MLLFGVNSFFFFNLEKFNLQCVRENHAKHLMFMLALSFSCTYADFIFSVISQVCNYAAQESEDG